MCQSFQYYSALLRGTCGRLCIVWRIPGVGSLGEWIGKFPDLAIVLRRSIMAASASVMRRHQAYLQSWPWRLWALGDLRSDLQNARAVAEDFLSRRLCFLPHGFAMSLFNRLQSEHATHEQRVEQLLAHRQALFCEGWALNLSIAPVERLH